jgi:hypothetical protein
MKYVLTADSLSTEQFQFSGECNICAVGSGEIRIQRNLGNGWYDVTNDRGETLAYVGNGVIFNGKIESSKSIPHRITASTTSSIEIMLNKER